MAGMWRESLIEQLLWHCPEDPGKKSRRPEWRAPTWSWASVDAEVQYFESEDRNEYVRVVDAWTRPSGPDPYGAVADGELTLSCAHLFRTAPGINPARSVEIDAEEQRHMESSREGVPTIHDCLGEVPEPRHGPFYLLPVIEGDTESVEVWPDGEALEARRMIQGLFLQPWSDASGSKYLRRVGSFHVSSRLDETRDTGLYQEIMDVLKTEDSSIAAAELSKIVPASEDEDGRLVIVIK